MRNTIDTSFTQHAVQAATEQTNQLYTSTKRAFPAKNLSKNAVTSTQSKLEQLAQNVDDRDQKKVVLKDKQDADAASHMLTIEETVKTQNGNLAQTAEDGSVPTQLTKQSRIPNLNLRLTTNNKSISFTRSR